MSKLVFVNCGCQLHAIEVGSSGAPHAPPLSKLSLSCPAPRSTPAYLIGEIMSPNTSTVKPGLTAYSRRFNKLDLIRETNRGKETLEAPCVPRFHGVVRLPGHGHKNVTSSPNKPCEIGKQKSNERGQWERKQQSCILADCGRMPGINCALIISIDDGEKASMPWNNLTSNLRHPVREPAVRRTLHHLSPHMS